MCSSSLWFHDPLQLFRSFSFSASRATLLATFASSCAVFAQSYSVFARFLAFWRASSPTSHWVQKKLCFTELHDWVVYRLGDIVGSVGHRVKIHKITPATGKERGDLEIKDYVVLQKPQTQVDRLPPPRTLILDFTMTHPRYGRSHVHPIGQMTNKTFGWCS
jgi:hypothetical protein